MLELAKTLHPPTFLRFDPKYKLEVLRHANLSPVEKPGDWVPEPVKVLVDYINSNPTSELHNASLELLLEYYRAGVSPACRSSDGTPAFWTLLRDPEILQCAITVGNCGNWENWINDQNIEGQTVLFHAAWLATPDTLQILLDNGADPNIKDVNELDCFQWMVLQGRSDMLPVLAKILPVEKAYQIACDNDDSCCKRVLEPYLID